MYFSIALFLHFPRFVRDVYQWSVLEDISIGSVIKSVTATDEDSGENARITYSLREGSPVDVFEIIPDSGKAFKILCCTTSPSSLGKASEITRLLWYSLTPVVKSISQLL